ncbi:LysR family transcriptional regulator [Leifsonia xyli subsp. xyli]|uniref:Transcriptional regulator, LysR family n=2 Tax=Leifsonia xyli subsp. xyli TaxID=59736 RepID=Q6AG19_LEIXX|nr:transcriptional regulator, LysR family [Leifsonia xyli subsp. xyli str. CTCB07]ODA91126.1 LysR family transcriptional regulator [Leifsonia xyli subsp. xyli]
MPPSRFTLAFPPGVTIGKWTRAFAERQPQVDLVVVPSADPLAVLTSGEADIVFARDAEAGPERHLIPLYTEDIVAVIHHEHLLTLAEKWHLADLTNEPRIAGEPGEATMRSVAAGDGVALLPASVAKAFRRKDVVALRLEDGPASAIGLIWPRKGQHPLVDEFIGIVRGRTAHSSRNPEVAERERTGKQRASKQRTGRGAPKPRRGRRWLGVMSREVVVDSANGWGSDGGVVLVMIVEVGPAGECFSSFGL